MLNRKYLMNNLIASLESFDQQTYVTDNDILEARNDVRLAQISLESYQEAFGLIIDLDKKDVLSLEAYSGIISLAEKNCNVPDILNISMEDDSKPSMIKQIKDKIKAAFTFLVDKMKNLFGKALAHTKSSIEKAKEIALKAKEKLSSNKETISQEAFGDLFKKKPLPVEKVFLLISKDGTPYPVKEMYDVVNYFTIRIGKETINFIGDTIEHYEKTFRIDLKKENYGWSGFDTKQAESLEGIIKSIGKEKLKPLKTEWTKADNLNAFIGFDFDKEKKIVTGASVISTLALLKDIGYKLPTGDVKTEKMNALFLASAIDATIKNSDKMLEHNDEMENFMFAMLSKMSKGVYFNLIDPKNELSDEDFDKHITAIKRSILDPIAVVFNILPGILEMQGRFFDQMTELMKAS